MRKILLLSFFLFLFSGKSFAQSFTGIITNEANEPLPGVTIKVLNTFQATSSNQEGKFSFDRIKPGKYQLEFSMLGYETQIKEIEQLQSGSGIDIKMQVAENLTDEVVVNALRAGKKTPVATTEINKTALQKSNLGQDVPYLLNLSTSITTSSDAGTGIGYSKLSIRGTDLTRINVTVNGIPLNDAESHGVWWVDLPDIASSVENIQIQRGVGSSTNGAAAFGANINFATNQLKKEAYSEFSASYGSFNSYKTSIKAGTGLINKHFAFDMRLSKIHSDGFIDRSRTDMESFFSSGSYSDSKTLIKINLFSGKENTYQAWNGIPKVRLENDTMGMQRYEDHYLYTTGEKEHMLNSNNRTYNYYTYENEIDDYKQTHFQSFISRELNKNLLFNLAFNYTKGKGYYEQYKNDEELSDYLIDSVVIGGETIKSTDLIRRKWLDNEMFVVNYSFDYKKDKLKAIIGGSWQSYLGKHYGNVIWTRFAADSEINHQWYYSTGDKKELNLYAKLEYLVIENLNLYIDLQYRKVNYIIDGNDDDLKDISQSHYFNFFNPKFGLNYRLSNQQHIYATFGIANREPSRTDFKDAINAKTPSHETLNDFELGYNFSAQKFVLNLNAYYMNYINQLVKTGKINDVGDAIMINIPESYRTGIEISSIYKLNDFLNWNFNATLSRNKIKEYTEYVDNWDEGGQNEIKIGKSNLSFSPEIVIGNEFEVMPFKGFAIALQTKYVGKQFIDNSAAGDRCLNAYILNNLRFNYHIETKFVKSINLQFMANNILNAEYETDAWVYRYYYNNEYFNMDGYFPQAGRNFLAGILLNF